MTAPAGLLEILVAALGGAAELASLAPEILLAANGTATVAPLLQATALCRSCS